MSLWLVGGLAGSPGMTWLDGWTAALLASETALAEEDHDGVEFNTAVHQSLLAVGALSLLGLLGPFPDALGHR